MVKKVACHHLLSSMSEYIDGSLSEDLCTELERHLETCENCQIVINTTRRTIELYHKTEQVDLPVETRKRLFACLDLEDYLVDPHPEHDPAHDREEPSSA